MSTSVGGRSPLDLTPEEILEMDRLASERLARYLGTLEARSPMGSAHDPRANSARENLKIGYTPAATPPEEPSAFEQSLDLVFSQLAPLSQVPGHPGYMAYVAGAGTHLASLAQMIAMDLNPFSGHRMMAPGLVALELEALGWFKSILGYPQEAAGFFTSGSSLATFSALVTARVSLLGDDFSRGTIYVSDQSHHSARKAARLAGVPLHHVRVVSSEPGTFRINLLELEKMIRADKASGHKPFFLVGNAGTTNTGAIDDLDSIASIAAREGIWFHADGAYGALFRVTREGRARLKGLERADSICFDPHKGFSLPYGTGALLVRDGRLLKTAHSGNTLSDSTEPLASSTEADSGGSPTAAQAAGSTAAAASDGSFKSSESFQSLATYMPPEPETDAAGADFADLSPELSRDWRGFRVWLPIKTLGLKPFRDNLDEKIRLARLVADELRATPHLEILAEPELSILAFGLSSPHENLTSELLARVNERGRIFLSGCTLENRKVVRVCLLGFRTREAEARLLVSEIRAVITDLVTGAADRSGSPDSAGHRDLTDSTSLENSDAAFSSRRK